MRALDKKLIRDLGRLWAQSLAVALVMACGSATLIMAVGTYRSLSETREAYYERYRFGDVFASAVRAPNAVAASIAQIDGVAAVEPRIVHAILLDIEGLREPATGLAISLPTMGEPAVNALFLREGRLPEPARANEVVVNVNFATAHGFSTGSTFDAIIGGSKVTLSIVGIVLSPEYVYALGPGDLMPDDRRFGIVWMAEPVLAGLSDLNGAFNSVSVRLLHGANETAVIEAVDNLLEPYGGTQAYGRKDQLSNAFLDCELKQLDGMARIIPPIFMAVSAFLINMILSRLVALEREQIGLLKAVGFGPWTVVWHYLKLVLMIAAIGTIIGAAIGTWAGHGLTILYSRFYSFPFLLFHSTPDIYVLAAAVSVLSAAAAGVRRREDRVRAAGCRGDAAAGAAGLSPVPRRGGGSPQAYSRSSRRWRSGTSPGIRCAPRLPPSGSRFRWRCRGRARHDRLGQHHDRRGVLSRGPAGHDAGIQHRQIAGGAGRRGAPSRCDARRAIPRGAGKDQQWPLLSGNLRSPENPGRPISAACWTWI